MYIEAQSDAEEEHNSLRAHFAAAQMSVHTKKPVKAKDLYKGRKLEAEERREAANRAAVERAKARLKGKTYTVNPKIQAIVDRRRKR